MDVCDGYAEHDEGLGLGNFPLASAPLPHPFCTCIWFVDTVKTLDQVAKELGRWEQGESNEALDRAFKLTQNNNTHYTKKFSIQYDSNITPSAIEDEIKDRVSTVYKQIMKDFPNLNETFEAFVFGDESGVGAARKDGKQIRLDAGAFSSLQSIQKVFEKAINTGHTRNARDPMFIVAHELGHIVDRQTILKKSGLKAFPRNDIERIVYDAAENLIHQGIYFNNVFTNESFEQIRNMTRNEMGDRALDGPDETVAQAFGLVYNGMGSHPIADAIIHYYMKEMR